MTPSPAPGRASAGGRPRSSPAAWGGCARQRQGGGRKPRGEGSFARVKWGNSMRSFAWVAACSAMLASLPAMAQTRLPDSGPVEHPEAGTTFPERFGDYRRVSAVAYGTGGRNLSAAYRLARGDKPLLVTVYIYPGGDRVRPAGDVEACRRQFEGDAGAVTRANDTARRRPPVEPLVVPSVPRNLSHRAVFDLERHASTPGPFVSQLDVYCYVGRSWIVKYRTTSAPSLDPAAVVAQFVRNGPWPGRAIGVGAPTPAKAP